jgi:hypothetical protein
VYKQEYKKCCKAIIDKYLEYFLEREKQFPLVLIVERSGTSPIALSGRRGNAAKKLLKKNKKGSVCFEPYNCTLLLSLRSYWTA